MRHTFTFRTRLFYFGYLLFNQSARQVKVRYAYSRDKLLERSKATNRLNSGWNGVLLGYLNAFFCASFFGLVQTVPGCDDKKILNKVYENVDVNKKDESVCILQSDEYFKSGKFSDSYEVLQYFKDSDNPEVLWRLGRALYNMSRLEGVKNSECSDMINKAFTLVQKALDIDKNNFAVHKWMAILLDAKSKLEGITSRLKALPDFKKHLLMAMDLNPKDATTIYILGQYCYNIASMPWYQKKLAASFLGTLPESSFEEALFYFTKAEEAEPNFYSSNLLMLGKTYLQLKKIEAARYWLRCASTYPIRTDEDKQVQKEAEELLKKYDKSKYKIEGESIRGLEKQEGWLKPGNESEDINPDTSLDLPLWMVLMLIKKYDLIKVDIPKVYQERTRDIFEADARVINLFRVNQHYYEFGLYLCSLNIKESELIQTVITQTFRERFRVIMDWADNVMTEASKIQQLDNSEKNLLKSGHRARMLLDAWLTEGCPKMKAADMVVNLKKRKLLALENN